MTKFHSRLAAAAVIAMIAGCSPGERGTGDVVEPPIAAGAASRSAAPARVAEPIKAAAENGAAFALELYGRLRPGTENVFISPVSVSTVFGMVQAGARGETADEIARTLHYDLPPEQLHAALGGLQTAARLNAPGRRLSMANALWAQRGVALKPEFTALAQRHYGGAVRVADYLREEEALAAINGWAAAQTNDRIRKVVTAADIDGSTRLILTNAVYFKADWATPFPKAATRPGPFRTPAGSSSLPLMQLQAGLRHLDGGSFQLLELPYRGGETSMLVWLPKAVDGLPALEAQLTAENFGRWTQALAGTEPTAVAVTLPRFTLRARLSLKPQLMALGMRRAFTAGADFSGIADLDLLISDVLQETFVAVDEVGTEAAAVTAVVIAETSAPPPPIEFRADHPFVFALRDNRTGALLFMGRLSTPPT